jgi:hypothetical protein
LTKAVMIAVLVPSEVICGELVCIDTVCFSAPTITVTFPVTVPEVAVTVMVEPGVAEPVESVAVALPVVSVVPWVTAIVPELAVNEIATPGIAVFVPSRARAVIVAEAEPSAGIVAALVDTEIVVSVPLPVVLVELLVVPWNASPPQAASAIVIKARTITEIKFRMTHPCL